jgi:uncharacterized damage-inducible protein DinB
MPGLPPPDPDELEQLLGFLSQERYVVRLAAFGMTDEQARMAPSVSSLSVGGILKHLTEVQEFWTDIMAGRREPSEDEGEHEYADSFRLAGDQTLQSVLDRYEQVGAETERVARSLGAEHLVAVPHDVPWFPTDVAHWTVRWLLLHLIEETSRHAGHADIVRESVDGATAFPLMAAAENWPPSPWLKPWEPPGEGAGTTGKAEGSSVAAV